MLIVSWNVNSLKQRMPRVLALLEEHRPDVVCLQETKCGPEHFPHLELQAAGYVAADHSRGRWAGVAILGREEAPPEEVATDLPGSPVAEEARWIEATVAGIRVASVYVINGRSVDDPMYLEKLTFLDAVRDRVAELGERSLVVAGDFNVAPRDEDVWDARAVHGATHVSQPERARLAAMLEAGTRDAWDATPERGEHRFTWWDYRAGAFHRDRGMRIDLALVSPDLAERLTWVGIDREFRKGEKPSDHAPLLVRLDGDTGPIVAGRDQTEE